MLSSFLPRPTRDFSKVTPRIWFAGFFLQDSSEESLQANLRWIHSATPTNHRCSCNFPLLPQDSFSGCLIWRILFSRNPERDPDAEKRIESIGRANINLNASLCQRFFGFNDFLSCRCTVIVSFRSCVSFPFISTTPPTPPTPQKSQPRGRQ